MARTYGNLLMLFFLTTSCATIERKVDYKDMGNIYDKTILVTVLSNQEKIYGISKGNIPSKISFEETKLDWKTNSYLDEKLELILNKRFKEVRYFSIKDFDKDLSFSRIIINSEKSFKRKFDYYLFIIPRNPTQDNEYTEYFNGCNSVLCLPVIAIPFFIESVYNASNRLVDSFFDDRKIKPLNGKNTFQYEIIKHPYKSSYKTECITSFDIALIKNDQKKFIAYKKVNYSDDINLREERNNLYSFNSFTYQQKLLIKKSCFNASLFGLNRGLYDMGLNK